MLCKGRRASAARISAAIRKSTSLDHVELTQGRCERFFDNARRRRPREEGIRAFPLDRAPAPEAREARKMIVPARPQRTPHVNPILKRAQGCPGRHWNPDARNQGNSRQPKWEKPATAEPSLGDYIQ